MQHRHTAVSPSISFPSISGKKVRREVIRPTRRAVSRRCSAFEWLAQSLSSAFWLAGKALHLLLVVIGLIAMSNNSEAASNDTSGSSSSNAADKPQIEPLRMPTPEEIRGQDIWNNCAVRSLVSGIMGGGLGVMMGLFFGALDNPILQEQMTTRQQLVYTAKQMGQRSWNSCKTFAVMGLIFSAAECVVEKARAKHDTTNTVIAGCVTGGAISARGGPQAACAGCAGFAAFSVVIEKFLERYE